MKMRIRQRAFSWFGRFDVADEMGDKLFTVEGKLSWGRCFHIFDAGENHVATLKQEVWGFLPRFEMYLGDTFFGTVKKEFSFLKPRFSLDVNGWQVQGNFMEWDYTVTESCGAPVAYVSKELFNWTDTYVIEVANPVDALCALMLVLAIDAEKCSRN